MDKGENSLKRKEHVPKPCGEGHSETWSGEYIEGGGNGIYDEAGRQLKAKQDGALAAMVSRFFDP